MHDSPLGPREHPAGDSRLGRVVELTTADGGSGLGWIGIGDSSAAALPRDHLLPRLAGRDSRIEEAVHRDAMDDRHIS